jgi:FAD/FMN-containing dehydrogenase
VSASRPPCVSAGDPGYEEARRRLSVSAVVPGDRPAVVVQARHRDDVVAAVRDARWRDLPLTVRSGGHSTAFAALRDGALAIDVSGLDDVEVDPPTATAWVGPGTTSLALAEALAGSGLAFPVGHKGDVGLGGFLLAGGNGWNQGAWGSAAESVLAAEVVLADGTTTTLDADDGDPFAVLRGAGPGFPAVVTRLRLRLWPEPTVRSRSLRIVADDAAALAHLGAWMDDLAARVAPEVELTLVLGPGAVDLGACGPEVVLRATAFGRDAGHAEALLATLDDDVPARATTYVRSATTISGLLRGELSRTGAATVAQQAWTRAGYAEVLPRLAAPLAASPSSRSSVLVSSASYRRSAPPSTTTLHRPLGTLTVAAYAVWDAGDRDAANAAWPTTVTDVLADLVTGHYVGEADLRRTPERLARCWEPGGLDRIEAVRARLDPGGRFLPPPGTPHDPAHAVGPRPTDKELTA